MDIKELSKKIDKYHEEDIKRAERDKKENLYYIAFAFAIATLGLAFSSQHSIGMFILIIASLFLIVIGIIALKQSQKSK